ncbi:hypothetical protein [Lacticaseibacillus absianus]|uniref:hypothetical protein n=1 Tax=Lacticaseibacillus absianus TaxID=2729623 RepID=UPI0015CBDAE2|nr:hypothetical protein [Lacticaseibacillus absianus]
MASDFETQRNDATITRLRLSQQGKAVHVIDISSTKTTFELSTDILLLGYGHPNKRVLVNLFSLGDQLTGHEPILLDSRGSQTIDGLGTINLETEFEFDSSSVGPETTNLLGLQFNLEVESGKDGSFIPHPIFSTIIPAKRGK